MGRSVDPFTSFPQNGLGSQRITTRDRAPIQPDARSWVRPARTETRYVPGGKLATPIVEKVPGAPPDEQKALVSSEGESVANTCVSAALVTMMLTSTIALSRCGGTEAEHSAEYIATSLPPECLNTGVIIPATGAGASSNPWWPLAVTADTTSAEAFAEAIAMTAPAARVFNQFVFICLLSWMCTQGL